MNFIFLLQGHNLLISSPAHSHSLKTMNPPKEFLHNILSDPPHCYISLRGWWGPGAGCRELWMPHPWRCSRLGWMGPWAAWAGEWQPCPQQETGTGWALRSLPTQAILWFYDSMVVCLAEVQYLAEDINIPWMWSPATSENRLLQQKLRAQKQKKKKRVKIELYVKEMDLVSQESH